MDNIYDRKARVRAPRVHITYEVETGDAVELRELPFVVGVLADLSAESPRERAPLRRRPFVEIDRDNFDDVLKQTRPRVALRVPNRLSDEATTLSAELHFEKLEDFQPEQIARQVQPLRELLEIRGQLKDLLSRMEGNDRLEQMLAEILDNAGVRDKLRAALASPQAEADEKPRTGGDS